VTQTYAAVTKSPTRLLLLLISTFGDTRWTPLTGRVELSPAPDTASRKLVQMRNGVLTQGRREGKGMYGRLQQVDPRFKLLEEDQSDP
jgi:hypothetical protein